MQVRSEETHARILDAAQYLFAQQGYDGTGVAQICEAAGVSKGAFYHHFPTKQAVFLELFQAWLSGLDEQLSVVRQEMDDIPNALVHMSRMMRDVFQAADGRLPMFLEFWSQSSHHPAIWQATIDPYRRYQAYFTNLVKEGISAGSFIDVDPEIAARVIVALAIGLLLQGLLDPQGADWEAVTRKGMQYLINGIAKETK